MCPCQHDTCMMSWPKKVGVLGGLRLSLAEEPKPALGRGLGLSKVFGWQVCMSTVQGRPHLLDVRCS